MDGDGTVTKDAVGHAQTITTTVQARTTGITDGFIPFYAQGKVGLDEFVWYIGETGPEGMTVWAITRGATRYTTETNLEKLLELIVFEARVFDFIGSFLKCLNLNLPTGNSNRIA